MMKKIINDCLNTVTFNGSKNKIEKAIAYINGEYGFNNECLGKNIEIMPFGYMGHTDWEPNILGVKRIADMFDLDFRILYDERGNMRFGEVNYRLGKIKIVELEKKDFDKVTYDDDSGLYYYGDQFACDINEFLVDLLIEKVHSNGHFHS